VLDRLTDDNGLRDSSRRRWHR